MCICGIDGVLCNTLQRNILYLVDYEEFNDECTLVENCLFIESKYVRIIKTLESY